MKRIVVELGMLVVACAGAAGAGYAYRGHAPARVPDSVPHADDVPLLHGGAYGGLEDRRDEPTAYYLIPDALAKDGYRMGTRADANKYRADMNADLDRETTRKGISIAGTGPDASRLQGGINPRTGPDRMIRVLAMANDSYMHRSLDKTRTTLDSTDAKNVQALRDALVDAQSNCATYGRESRKLTVWANGFSRDPAVSGYTKGLTDAEYLYCVEEARNRGFMISDVVPDNL